MHLILILGLALDLASVRSEPNLEKRSERALDNATVALDAARDAYSQGDIDKAQASLTEVGESVDLCYQSLSESGKDPRRDPKFFKRAEVRTRELLRRLEGLRETMSVADRAGVEKIRDSVSDIHDNLLKGIMSKKKK
jgi:hypothetical protein